MMLRTALVSSLFLAGAAHAQDAEMRQLGAHVHGEAALAVAADASGLVLAELTGAAYNFYGFESAAETDAQRESVAAAHAAFDAPGLVSFPDRAACTLTETVIEGGPGAGHDHDDHHDHGDDHGDHDHGHHDHGDDHGDHEHGHHDHGDDPAHDEAHDHDDDHGHGHDDHDHAAHNHADVLVSLSFQCERPAAITQIDASGLFAAFERLEALDAQFFDGDQAAASELTADAPVLTVG